jgi:hypothetical protein
MYGRLVAGPFPSDQHGSQAVTGKSGGPGN